MLLFIYKKANALSRFSCMLVPKYVLISFEALNNRSPVAFVTGNVAKIYSNVSVIEYAQVVSSLKSYFISAKNTTRIHFQMRAFLLLVL